MRSFVPGPTSRVALSCASLGCSLVMGCYETHGGDDVGPVDARSLDVGDDAFVVPSDAFVVPTDASVSPTDAFVTPHDAFVVPTDAFVVPTDAFVVPVDAFVVPTDAFVVPVDAFVVPVDAFSPDTGRPPSSDALRFTSSEVMTVPDRPALSIGPDLTLELWARLRSEGIIAIKGDPSVGSHLYLEARPRDADGVFRTFWTGWSFTGTRVIVPLSAEVPADTWTHFALVQRQSSTGRVEVSVYVNGESVVGPSPIDAGEVSSYLASFNAAPFTVGQADMDVDEIRLWRVPRGQAGIRAYMRSELSPGVSGLIAYWPLDGVGQVVLDRSLSGNDGFRGTSPSEDRADPTWIADGAF